MSCLFIKVTGYMSSLLLKVLCWIVSGMSLLHGSAAFAASCRTPSVPQWPYPGVNSYFTGFPRVKFQILPVPVGLTTVHDGSPSRVITSSEAAETFGLLSHHRFGPYSYMISTLGLLTLSEFVKSYYILTMKLFP